MCKLFTRRNLQDSNWEFILGVLSLIGATTACKLGGLVLLRIPSSRPSPRTFLQFVRIQILGFLAAENDGFKTYVRKFFSPNFSKFIPPKPRQNATDAIFHLPIDILQQQRNVTYLVVLEITLT